MYKSDFESEMLPINKISPLSERNEPSEPGSGREWLHSISEGARRRAAALVSKQRREKLRRRRAVRTREYQRLRNMVPSIAAKPLVSKVTVIEEAIRYIDYLHSALLTRLRTKGLPNCLRGSDVDVSRLSLEDMKSLVCQLVVQKNSQKQTSPQRAPSPISFFERSRHAPPSYLTARRLPKRT